MIRLFSISAAMFLASITLCQGFSGRLYPVFEMDGCVGNASLIVRGFLDEKGNLDSSEVFKGSPPAQQIAIAEGEKIYQGLLAGMKEASAISSNAIEVVAFLGAQTKDGWQPDLGYAGVAGLEGTNVFLFGYGKVQGVIFDDRVMPVGLDKLYTRESFLSAIKEEVRLDEQLDALCALPHTAANAQRILAFLLEHNGWYHHRRIVESLRPSAGWVQPINAEVQTEVLEEIANTVDVTNKCVLLGLAADLHLSKEAFTPIAPLIETNHPPEVRQAAIWTLFRIDPSETTALLLPLITLKEPALYAALNVLQSEDSTMDLKIVDTLLSFSQELRQQEAKNPRPASFNDEETLRQQLVRHVHPTLISFYFDWLHQNKPASPAYVTSDLQAMLGVKWERNEFESWWKQNRRTINSTYNLQNEAGRRRWFSTYQKADEVTKHILVRLWMLTPKTNQVALVKAVTDEKTAVMAKTAITELWNAKHLSNAGIQAMFENFVKVDFIDLDKTMTNRFKSQHQLTVVLTFNYPFNIFVNYRHPIAIDGKVFPPTTSLGGVGLEPKMKEYRLGVMDGYVPGQVATGTLEIFQLEHYPDGKELWHAQWDLGPVQLGQ